MGEQNETENAFYIRNIRSLNREDSALAGGKGASLGELTKIGISVPSGFVVLSQAFEDFMKTSSLEEGINLIYDKINFDEIHSIDLASEKIRNLILTASIPREIEIEILKEFRGLKSKFVAVRSSATSEDSLGAAWAGQLDSFLNTTENSLIKNVKMCWASLFTPRAISYRFEKNLSTTNISVAVVVQKMIESEVSGTAFSVHPVTQDQNTVLIEAGYGLGEAIVSGQITPDSYNIEKNNCRILDKKVNMQDKKISRSVLEGNVWHDVSLKNKLEQKLTDEQIIRLFNIVIAIEKHYSFPCDIEWAFEKNKFYIVQSRPITTLIDKRLESKRPTWTKILTRHNSVFMDYMKLYASANLFNDLGYDYRLRSYKIVNGDNYVSEDYEYLVEGLKKHLEKHKNFLSEIMIRSKSDIDSFKKVWNRIANTAVNTLSDNELKDLFEEYLQTLYKLMSYLFLPLSAEKVLANEVESILKKGSKNEDIMSNFQKIAYPSQRSLIQEEKIEFLYLINILKKEGIESFTDIKTQSLLKSHLTKWAWLGDHFYQGTFLAIDDFKLRFEEWIKKDCLQEIKSILEFEKTQKYEAEQIVKDLSLMPEEIETIQLAQKYVHFRTYRLDMLFYSEYSVKNLLEELANRMNLSFREVLRITPQEIISWFEKRIDLENVLAEREKGYAIVLQNYQLSIHSGDSAQLFAEFEIMDKSSLSGNVAYPGNVRGYVKIIRTKSDFYKLYEGDILVTHMTTPDFVPLMRKSVGIITDEGGMTCHAAIVSRELRIPCVIGTKRATQVLNDGDLIEIDGKKGKIIRLKESQVKNNKNLN
ncbi:MAG: PEP/pyruvate-binding domain-containing protein [Nanoarchaeota archaeon]